jgi:UTP--glucose-1-phosphate uridylyltransferase
VHGVLFRGRRYDTGNKLDYLKTQIKFACERPDIKGDFVPWLRSYLQELSRDSGRVGGAPPDRQSGAAP